VAALSPNERTQTRTQSDLLKKLQSLAAEAEQAKSANEVGGETADANLTLTNLFTDLRAVFRIRIQIRIHRIHMFLGLMDPDPVPLVRGMDPAPDPDSSIIKQK
jgi:hypothetical protein